MAGSRPCSLQAFDDCTTISITFKLLDSFEGLLDREVIAADLEKKHADLLGSYANDLKVRARAGSSARPGLGAHAACASWPARLRGTSWPVCTVVVMPVAALHKP